MSDADDIHRLVSLFFNALDARDAQRMSDCFTPDGRMGMFAADLEDEATAHWVEGRPAIAEFAGWLSRYESTIHQVSNIGITVDGDAAECSLNATVFLAGADDTVQVRGIAYRDRFARLDGRWYFTSRMHRPLWQFDGALVPIHVPQLGA